MNQSVVLVVEDDKDLRGALEIALKTAGFEVYTAEDGEEGLKFALDKHPDVILLDILLPKMHGNLFLERIRGNEWGKTAKVIILTNFDSSANKERAQLYGPVDFLIKSQNSLAEIVELVQKTITQK